MFNNQTVLDAKRIGVLSCPIGTTLGDAARCMVREDISTLVVTDSDGCLAGIITRTDLLRALLTAQNWEARSVEEFMNPEVITVDPQTKLDQVAQIMLEKHIHRVVVIRDEDGKKSPISVVSSADLVYHMVKEI